MSGEKRLPLVQLRGKHAGPIAFGIETESARLGMLKVGCVSLDPRDR